VTPLAVTLLYVPADRADRVAKALSLGADVVIVDLEDAVAPVAKPAAREALPSLLAARGTRRVQVRVNALGSPWADEDLAMVGTLDAEVELRLPKVSSADTVDAALEAMGSPRPVHCLLESAVAVERAFNIARHSPAVASIALGEQDLRSELGVTAGRGLDWARGRTVVAARAAGLPPPVQSVFPAVRDVDGLARSCREGRTLGVLGRCAIHPDQLAVIRAAYRPSADEVRHAHEVLDRLAEADDAGSGVAVLSDGTFVDAAMLAGARLVLEVEALTR
jgi:citrate lyase subunit beta/citryl-CoA lyase